MHTHSLPISRIMRVAAGAWLGYLFLLLIIDLIIYPPTRWVALRGYYVGNTAVALLFLLGAYAPYLPHRLRRAYIPLMLLIILGLPIFLGRAGMFQLPPAPLVNQEGMALRLLPVLFLGLIITAWVYGGRVVAVVAVATAGLEIGLLQFFPPPRTATAAHAVFFISIVRSVSFLVVGLFISYLMRQLRQQQAQLTRANAQLRHYAATQEQLTLSRERNRLARELHDTLAHTLSALVVQLETVKAYWAVQPETAQKLLGQSLAVTRDGLTETREALKALRATPLEDLGLLVALQRLAETAVARHNFTLHLDLPPHLPTLPDDVAHALYRIAQESIANVGHHAHAQNLTVQLTLSDEEIGLLVADDGLGFVPETAVVGNHYGVAGMKERAQLVNGRLSITSQPKQGTRVQFTVRRGDDSRSHL
ncbi:MAG: sensor histidine kinase [Anaerolinea sp.]|nr:sensor histidine kinase [Anaerolinea sp.]